MSNSSLVVHTNLSPNCTKPRNHAIDTITIHCTAGQCTAESLCNYSRFTKYDPINGASCNYVVGKDGSIGLCVEECNRSWCSSNKANDMRAVTIEVSSDAKEPCAVTDVALKSLVVLVADICKRNKIDKLVDKMIKNQETYQKKINDIVDEYVYNLGKSGEVGAEYIIKCVQDKIEERRKDK